MLPLVRRVSVPVDEALHPAARAMWHETRMVLREDKLEVQKTRSDVEDEKEEWWVSRASMATRGVWVSAADLVPWGGVPGTDVSARITVFGVPVCTRAASSAKAMLQKLDAGIPPHAGLRHGVVLYHGTHRAGFRGIRDSGFRLSPSLTGMLGPGVYLGSFWKAVRFASRDGATYALRSPPEPLAGVSGGGGGGGCAAGHEHLPDAHAGPAVVCRVRLLVDVRRQVHFASFRDEPCVCTRYCNPPTATATTKPASSPWSSKVRRVVDHDATWCRHGYLASAVLPAHATHPAHPGKRVVTNEEFVALPHALAFRDAAAVDLRSIHATPEGHYDPLQRSQRIV